LKNKENILKNNYRLEFYRTFSKHKIMKILQINPFPPENLGGSEIFCKNLAINLKNRYNVDVDILTSDFLKRNIKCDFLKEYSIKVFYKHCYINLLGKNPIVNVINFLNKNAKYYDLIHIHSYIFLTSLQTSFLKKIKKFSLLLHLHGFEINPLLKEGFQLTEKIQLFLKKKIFDKFIAKFLFNNSDAIISITKKDLVSIMNEYNLKKEKLFYVPNAVDTEKFRFYDNFNKKYITFIGRLSYVKGIDIFLKLAQKLYEQSKKLRFLIIGSGPLNYLVKNYKNKIPIKHIKKYPYEKMQDIYNMSKLLLITSRFEGLPTTLLESLSCKTPVISTQAGGIGEIITPGINGYFIDINNIHKSAKLILNLYENEQKIKSFGDQGRNLVENNFSWKVVSRKIFEIYKKILSPYF